MDNLSRSEGSSSSSNQSGSERSNSEGEELKVMDDQTGLALVLEEANREAKGYHVPRILRFRSSDAVPPSSTPGYHPILSVNYAEAHCWVAYKSLLSVLREAMVGFVDHSSMVMLQLKLKELMMRSPCPFSSNRRFPAGEVYVCLDRLPFIDSMWKLHRASALVSSSSYDDNINSYYKAIREAMRLLSKDSEGPFPLLFSRSIFESYFLLRWIEETGTDTN
uniref:Uncharacterized protein n=1 Tax=Nelumbo nucifera TaxID=4432 RepID=A0A822XWZ9_NELNU|nr:TPA_asm: hypothetical protein HUJ06_025154 [Nelumbo nucifera]